ncbi:MAG: hypothetical protein SGPRY_001402 [Prymnesium sp.]
MLSLLSHALLATVELTPENFDSEVFDSGKSAFIKFLAPCRFGVEGYPTIKYFNPPDDDGESYEGERDEESLVEFANTKLGPGCSIQQPQYCTAEEKKKLEEVIAMPEEERANELASLTAILKEKEKEHEELLERLQQQYEDSSKALEDLKTTMKPRIKLLKKAAVTTKPAEQQDKGEL